MKNMQSDTESSFHAGWLAKSKAGHDKGKVYVILSVSNDGVYVSDGRLRLTEKPKRKNPKHLQPIKVYAADLLPPDRKKVLCNGSKPDESGSVSGKILQPDRLRNEDIICILRQYGRNMGTE